MTKINCKCWYRLQKGSNRTAFGCGLYYSTLRGPFLSKVYLCDVPSLFHLEQSLDTGLLAKHCQGKELSIWQEVCNVQWKSLMPLLTLFSSFRPWWEFATGRTTAVRCTAVSWWRMVGGKPDMNRNTGILSKSVVFSARWLPSTEPGLFLPGSDISAVTRRAPCMCKILIVLQELFAQSSLLPGH